MPTVSGADTTCAAEAEPNDQPDGAGLVSQSCLSGTLSDDDKQDFWKWQVTDAAATHTITLQTSDSRLTRLQILRVDFDAQGRVRKSKPLYELQTTSADATRTSEPLLLTPGDYFIGIAGSGGASAYTLSFAAERLPSQQEAEPNNRDVEAMPLAGAFMLQGKGDTDFYAWTISEAEAQQRWAIKLTSPLGGQYTLNLMQSMTRPLAKHGGATGVRALSDLGLAAGTYHIQVRANSSSKDTPYILSAQPGGQRSTDFEEEPNNRKNTANTLYSSISGRLDEASFPTDLFTLAPRQTSSSHEIVLETASTRKRKLCLLTADFREVHCREGTGRIALNVLDLDTRPLVLRVTGESDPGHLYSVAVNPQQPFRPNGEREPNDAWQSAAPLPIANAVRGRFDGKDTDFYTLRTSGEPQYWRIQAVGKGVEKLALHNAKGDQVAMRSAAGRRSLRLSQVYLLPGTHYIGVRGKDSDYIVRALAQGPPDPNIEREPNDEAITAMPIRFGQTRRGVLPPPGDRDFYRFRLTTQEHVEIEATPPPGVGLRMQFAGANSSMSVPVGKPGEPTRFNGVLLPGDHVFRLFSQGDSEDAYAVRLARVSPEIRDTGITMDVQLAANTVQAFSEWHQTVSGSLTVSNEGSAPAQLRLSGRVSQALGTVALDRTSLPLAPGASASVALSIDLPPDLWSSQDPVLMLEARADAVIVAQARVGITASSTAPAAAPHFAFEVPDPLLGTIDVAATGLGAQILDGDKRAFQQDLHDHYAPVAGGQRFKLQLAQNPLPHPLQVKLAPHSGAIVGFALHPGLAGISDGADRQLKAFELQLSNDGSSYTTVYTGELSAQQVTRYFELGAPHKATHARLVLLSTHGNTRTIALGSWRVLAQPDAITQPINIADPKLGGHIVSHDLQSRANHDYATSEESPLIAGGRPWPLQCRKDCRDNTFVVGFHAQRAAEISSIELHEAPSNDGDRLREVSVFISSTSPVGPWQPAGVIKIADTAAASHTLAFDTPLAARYVRFVIPSGEQFRSALPDVIRILERPVDGSYRSVLGDWGSTQLFGHSVGNAQWRQNPRPQRTRSQGRDSETQPIPLEDRVSGTVSVGVDTDRYRFTAPPGMNTMRLTVSGSPSVPRIELLGGAGATVSLFADEDEPVPGKRSWRASVEPGETYQALVYEPPRSVIFVWDTSGSVAPFRPMIYRALEKFAAGVRPGQEVVNLMPFEQGLLLDRWESEPTLIWEAVQDFYRNSESSQTALTLLEATEALAQRDGSRSVVIIGDMDLHWFESRATWRALTLVQPHVYLFQVARPAVRSSAVTLPNWARVNHGDWRITDTIADLEVGFERATARIRRPVDYELESSFSFTEPPGPGRLNVVSSLVKREDAAERTVLGNTAVEFILDASGSMLQRLSGARRIDIAKETLTTLATSVLPEGTPVALRVFGHLEGNYSCRTDLVSPLMPLSGTALARTIGDIEAQNLAATPIAASLAKVGEDLDAASGAKMVVLITDGEETCEGDPAMEIERLRQQGLDLRVNIIGFAIDDEALKSTFTGWAKSGGGDYFDASSATGLNDAIAMALRMPFRVRDEQGEIVGTGTVNGDTIELTEGVYAVEVLAEPTITIEGVIVTGDLDETVIVE